MRNGRRLWLARAAAGGAAAALGMARVRAALAADAVKQGVARVRGEVRIDGRMAKPALEVRPGDTVVTGRDAELVAVIGRDAFLVRSDSRIEFSRGPGERIVGALRVVTGALLSVFAPGEKKQIRTHSAAIGIRGTGIYVEIENVRTYVCTCYGEAELVPVDDPRQVEVVRTTHHDQPRYVYPKGMPRMIEKAPVINHTDAELIMLESLVGRTVPFDPSRY